MSEVNNQSPCSEENPVTRRSMKPYYECHITIASGDPEMTAIAVKNIGWKFSAIDGDPSLGDGVHCYATKNFNHSITPVEVIREMYVAATQLKEVYLLRVIRQKVEVIIFDKKEIL